MPKPPMGCNFAYQQLSWRRCKELIPSTMKSHITQECYWVYIQNLLECIMQRAATNVQFLAYINDCRWLALSRENVFLGLFDNMSMNELPWVVWWNFTQCAQPAEKSMHYITVQGLKHRSVIQCGGIFADTFEYTKEIVTQGFAKLMRSRFHPTEAADVVDTYLFDIFGISA